MENTIKFGFKVPFYPLQLIYSSSHYAEKSRLHSIWSADHFVAISLRQFECFSSWCILSSLATITKHVLLGCSVTDPCRYHPAFIAQASMTINSIAENRFILGIGAGEAQNTVPYGIECQKKVERLEESIIVLKELFQGKQVNYEGRFFKLVNALIRPSSKVPIWIGANSPKTIKLTSQLADGWIPLAIIFPPDKYKEKLVQIMHFRKSKNFESGIFIHMAIDKDQDAAAKKAEIAGKLQLIGWTPEVFSCLDSATIKQFHFNNLTFTEISINKLTNLLKNLPMDPLYERIAIGKPSDCIEYISKYVSAGARHIIVSFFAKDENDFMKSLKLYTEEVVKYFNDNKC